MPTIERETTINQAPDKVFAILDDPEQIKSIAPGVNRVTDVKQTNERIGDSVRVTYSVLGLRFPMKFTITEHDPPSKLVSHMEGGMTGTFNWALKPEGGSTRTHLTIDYEMKGGILGKAMNALLVERMNEKNAERMLENLKMVAEGQQ
jgi:carbon monoxide dehydrogenase subunit G